MNRNRISMAIVTIVVVFSAFVLGNISPRLTNRGKPLEQTSSVILEQPFTACNNLDDASDLMWDGSRIVSRSGIHYATVEVTRLVYGGGVPSEIGLKIPVSIDGVTFTTTNSDLPSFQNMTLLLGVLYITTMFADGTQRKLSTIIFPPAYNVDGSPRGCALLVTHENQQAGFAFVFTPSTEPLDNPALGYSGVAGVFQGRIYLIVRL